MKALSHSDAYQVLLLQIADELLDAVAGGVLDDSHKRYIKVIAICYKGTGNSLEQTLAIRRNDQAPQEELDYLREIWDSIWVRSIGISAF